MDKKLLKSPWMLAALLLAIGILIGFIFLAVAQALKLTSYSMSAAAGFITAMLVGQIYSASFKEVMPKKLRLNATAIYIIAQLMLGLMYFIALDIPNMPLFLGLLIGFSALYFVLTYFALGWGGKSYLKSLAKKEAALKK